MSKTSKILKGEFPKDELTLDQQVQIVNAAGDKLAERVAEGKSIDKRANNLFLWLGGQNKDVQLYACQYIFNVKNLEIEADEKTEARLAFMEPHFEYGGKGYTADTFQAIDHRPWPVEYLDGTTFEDRLEDLAKEVQDEQDITIVTVDMVLSGTAPQRELDLNQAYALINACGAELQDRSKGTNTTLYYEQFNRLIDWLMLQQPEIGIMAMRSMLTVWKLPVDRKKLPSFVEFTKQYSRLITD